MKRPVHFATALLVSLGLPGLSVCVGSAVEKGSDKTAQSKATGEQEQPAAQRSKKQQAEKMKRSRALQAPRQPAPGPAGTNSLSQLKTFVEAAKNRPEVAADDPLQRLIVLLPDGPLRLDLLIFLDGEPFRRKFESLVDELLERSDTDGDGRPTWKEALAGDVFTTGSAANRFQALARGAKQDDLIATLDIDRDGTVDRREARAALTYAFGGTVFSVIPAATSSGSSVAGKRLVEALEQGTTAHIRAGEGDERYFVDGWHPPVSGRNVTARWTDGPRGTMRLPMLAGRDHRLVLRLSPAPGGSAEPAAGGPADPDAGGSVEASGRGGPQAVTVSLNGVQLARLDLEWDPSRVGSYEVEVPGEVVRDSNRLELVGSRVVRTGRDPETPLVPADRRVAFMVWYVNVVPTEADDTG